MEDLSLLSSAYLECLYRGHVDGDTELSPSWRKFFDALQRTPLPSRLAPSAAGDDGPALQEKLDRLVRAYRVRGHLIAKINPLQAPRAPHPELDPAFYKIRPEDWEKRISSRAVAGGALQTVGEVILRLRETYCMHIGVQFMHIDDVHVHQWLQQRMESTGNHIELSSDEQLRILTKLTDAAIFESFVQKKYTGAKRFSLEGAESLLPLLDLAINKAGDQGVEEIVLAMAHRGRLNVLANILAKSPRLIFHEFEDPQLAVDFGRGDVKYHLGFSSDWTTPSGKHVHLSLCFNPSHLEFVNPVALGRVRAKQDRRQDAARKQVMGLLIHGDASFAGQGVVQETLNLSRLPAYFTGGTIHIIVNNQIGYTTPPREARSSTYATDVGKMIQGPIFHVNGENPEAVAQVIALALDFRREFQRDVLIDMYCYRKQGHNEGDDASFTQPLMYQKIRERPSVLEAYGGRLLALGGVTEEQIHEIGEQRRQRLESELEIARTEGRRLGHTQPWLRGVWSGYQGGHFSGEEASTHVEQRVLGELIRKLVTVPENFNLHPRLARTFKQRLQMASNERPLDWSTAESLAFATLALEGHPIRFTGQDTARGTFSQRHAVLFDMQHGHAYMPLANLDAGQASVEIYNSPLSEAGVLGFEYGYSLDTPEGLVLWEAQFGDFINAAQVIVDQFICSAEEKWNRLSGLVLLLPHGFEGQGPEHSGGRLERFLLQAAEDNMQIVNCTTPAQYFHLLRRQVKRTWRKPLVVMTPKSLLRNPRSFSALEQLAEGEFMRVIPDSRRSDPSHTTRIILCSGKVYYELSQALLESRISDIALVRIEELYPFPDRCLQEALQQYPPGTEAVWVQEEPENMGAWPFVCLHFGERLYDRFPLSCLARRAAVSPGTGSASTHALEQHHLVNAALKLRTEHNGILRTASGKEHTWP